MIQACQTWCTIYNKTSFSRVSEADRWRMDMSHKGAVFLSGSETGAGIPA